MGGYQFLTKINKIFGYLFYFKLIKSINTQQMHILSLVLYIATPKIIAATLAKNSITTMATVGALMKTYKMQVTALYGNTRPFILIKMMMKQANGAMRCRLPLLEHRSNILCVRAKPGCRLEQKYVVG